MARRNIQPREVAQWIVGVACVALAWGILQVLPPEDAGQEPFAIPVNVGEAGVGRAFQATVTDIVLADELVTGEWRMPARWLVADVVAMGLEQETAALVSHTVLVVGDRQYRASERPPDTLLREQMLVGVPRSGILAFELADDVGGSAQLQLALNADPRLDSMIVLDLDLDALDRVDEHEYVKVGWLEP